MRAAMEARRLESPPSLAPLYAKALLGPAIPGGSRDGLPETELVLEDVGTDRERLAEYARVCGFPVGDLLPSTYPHVLAFPLSMALMTDRAFPFPLLGLVHIANRIEQRRPLHAGERFTLRVRAENLRPHPKGRQLDLVAEADADGETVWEDRSTYLRRGGGESENGGSGRPEPSAENGDRRRAHAESPPEASATWTVPGDVGRRYAGVSGDRNPIHMNGLAAKAFGFPRAIAHGMWMKAHALAALQGSVPAAHRVEVQFKAPLLIPAKVGFAAWRENDGGPHRFALTGKRPHLLGTLEELA